MKRRRLISILLSAMLMASMACPPFAGMSVFAAEEADESSATSEGAEIIEEEAEEPERPADEEIADIDDPIEDSEDEEAAQNTDESLQDNEEETSEEWVQEVIEEETPDNNSDDEPEEYADAEADTEGTQNSAMENDTINDASSYVAQAIWTEGNSTLTFYFGPQAVVGDTYNGETVSDVWSGASVAETGYSYPGWRNTVKDKVTSVCFDSSFLVVRPTSTFGWFCFCNKLTQLDLKGLNTSLVTTMSDMFYGCSSLTSIDLSGFDTSNVKSLYSMFSGCSNLKSIDLSSFNTVSVTSMASMFNGCSSLTSLDLRVFDTSAVKDMSSMFYGCSSLTAVDVSSFDTSSVTKMPSMFEACSSLVSLNLSNFDTAGVIMMGKMFYGCSSLTTIDVSGFDLSGVEGIGNLFNGCSSLKTIYCEDETVDWSKQFTFVRPAPDFFGGCSSLSGVYGETTVAYDSSKTDSSMAKSANLGGYFSPRGAKHGTCGNDVFWELSADGTLTIYGSGETYNYHISIPPWHSDLAKIKKIVIKDGVTKIGKSIFADCTKAVSVEIADSVTDIGDEAFYGNKSLSYIWIPSKVTTVGSFAFYGCSGLQYVTFGESVSQINEQSFGSCSSLEAVFFMGTPASISDEALSGCGTISALYAPERASYWNDNNKRNYGAEEIRWQEWSDNMDFGFDQAAYSVSVNDTEFLYASFYSYNVPFYSFTISCEPEDLFEYKAEFQNVYDGYVGMKITGRKTGKATITLSGFTPLDRSPVKTSAVVWVTESSGGGQSAEEIKNKIVFPIESTYQFKNPGDSILEGGMKYYLRYFDPAQAELVTKAKYADGTSGQCFGMCFSAAATGKFEIPHVSSYNGNPKGLSDVSKDAYNNEIEMTAADYIKYAHIYQYTAANHREKFRASGEPEDLYRKVVEYVKGASPVAVFLAKESESGSLSDGHVLLARGIKKNDSKKTEIVVYDCNYPKREDCKIVLNKENGKYTSWEYKYGNDFIGVTDYSSEGSGIMSWSTDIQGFLQAFHEKSGGTVGKYNYRHLFAPSVDGTTIKTKDGTTINIAGQNTDDPDVLLPIIASADNNTAESDGIDMYWLNLDDEYTIESPDQACSYEIASPNSGAAFSLPADSKAEVLVGDEVPNHIAITTQGALQYAVTFTNTNDEGTDVDTCKVSGEANGNAAVTQAEEGIVVSGKDLEEVIIEDRRGTNTYDVPEEVDVLLVKNDGTAVYEGLRDLSQYATVLMPDKPYQYTGSAIEPDITVKDIEGRILVQGEDYSVRLTDNTEPGTATAVITGIGSYSGSVTQTFRILPGKTTRGDMFNLANNVKVTWKAVPGAKYYKVYREGVTDKKETRTEPVIVTTGLIGWDKDPGLTNGHAYRYKIVASFTGKGDPSGDSTLSYSKLMYRLKTVVIRSAKNTAPGKVTVKYDKTTSGDSYVLQYCERQDMVGAKTKVVLGANNMSYVIGGLKKGKTYYISIRVRKKVNGIDYYTTFGVPKKVTITQ